MQVAEQDRVDVGDLCVALQYAQGAVAEVEQEPEAVGLDEVRRRGRVRARQRTRAAENGQSHRRTSTMQLERASLRRQPRPRAEEPPAQLGERARIPGGSELVHRRRKVVVAHQSVPRQDPVDVLRRLLGAAHQRHRLSHDVGHDPGEQRVVGAAEHQGVDAGVAAPGSRYSWATRSSSGPCVTPVSTNSTKRGHAWVVICR